MICDGELGKAGLLAKACVKCGDYYCTKNPCIGCSVCHGNCGECGGSGRVEYEDDNDGVDVVVHDCLNYQPAKGGA